MEEGELPFRLFMFTSKANHYCFTLVANSALEGHWFVSIFILFLVLLSLNKVFTYLLTYLLFRLTQLYINRAEQSTNEQTIRVGTY